MVDPEIEKAGFPRPQARRFVATLVLGTATALVLGLTLRTPSQLEANDISRWCTVWSLLEEGTYAIDNCPWQSKTQDKVKRPPAFHPDPGSGRPITDYEHYYSSKPPLLPTIIAGILYPFHAATGVPLEGVVEQERLPRYTPRADEDRPGQFRMVLETPKETVKWPTYVFYFKPIIVLVNIVPMFVFLALYARHLDRHAANDWAWFFSLFAAAFGTYLFAFEVTLNNHTVAAYSAFFALYAMLRVFEGDPSPRQFVAAGFFGAFCACNELPAALFGVALFVALVARAPRSTLIYFVPAAAVPILAFLTTQYLAFGQFRPVYEEFGTKSYNYEGSYWNTPLEFDYLNKEPESYPIYLFHMTFGHHGVFSLTPVFLLSLYGVVRNLRSGRRGMSALAWMTLVLTVAMFAFYLWNPKARNYGGSTQGLRWLFWLIPFWLLVLPAGVEAGQERRGFRRLSLAALVVSAFSVGYALRTPWSHPWFLDMIEHLNQYTLPR